MKQFLKPYRQRKPYRRKKGGGKFLLCGKTKYARGNSFDPVMLGNILKAMGFNKGV